LLVRPAALGRMALTFAFICLTWVFFRASSVSEAGGILWRMIADIFDGEAWRQLGAYLADKHSMMRTLYLLTAFVVVEWLRRDSEHPLVLTLLPKWIRRGNAGIRRATVALAAAARADRISRRLAARAVRLLPPRWLRWSIYVILIVLTLDVSPEEISAFAYGQF